MKYEEFNAVMIAKNVKHHKVNGFSFSLDGSRCAKLVGKIPLSLARKISEGIDNNKLQICVQGGASEWSPDDLATNAELTDIIDDMYESELFAEEDIKNVRRNFIRFLEYKNCLDEVYIMLYHIYTVEGLCRVIDCIRQGNYENECLLAHYR